MASEVRQTDGPSLEERQVAANAAARQILKQNIHLYRQGINNFFDIPFVRQERNNTCLWACFISIARTFKARFGTKLMYPDYSEATLLREAKQVGLLQDDITDTSHPKLQSFVASELGLNLSVPVAGPAGVINKVLVDNRQGNLTIVSFPRVPISHSCVANALIRTGDSVAFSFMDPQLGLQTSPQDEFINRLSLITRQRALLQAVALTVHAPHF